MQEAAATTKPAKRRRLAYSCAECRRRKVRCDRDSPCGQCVTHGQPSCTYEKKAYPQSHSASSMTRDSIHDHRGAETTIRAGEIIGAQSKTRVYGHGHWISIMPLASELPIFEQITEYQNKLFRSGSDLSHDKMSQNLAHIKSLARQIKNQRPHRRRISSEVFQSLPSRHVIDKLATLYFETYESCYRILHWPSFERDYGSFIDNLADAPSYFVIELILILSASCVLHDDSEVRCQLAERSVFWIDSAQNWLSVPFEKDKLTLKGVQIFCLLVLNRQIHRRGADLVWISLGSLIRVAIQMGLHQDPMYLKSVDHSEEEIRRRLWYTILEMDVQAALDSGTAPLITVNDYNTQPPSGPEDVFTSVSDDPGRATRTPKSFQSLLANSYPLRLRAAKMINSLHEEPSYDDVISLGRELSTSCHEAANEVPDSSDPSITRFAYCFCSHLLSRFLLCLHFRYALQALKNPLYAHSLKVCLGVALDLISFLDNSLYGRLLVSGGGMFRDIITRGVAAIFLEMNSVQETSVSIFADKASLAQQRGLLEQARRVLQYTHKRICQGETNSKGYLFLRIAAARAEALIDGVSVENAMRGAALEGLEECEHILEMNLARLKANAAYFPPEAWEFPESMHIPSIDEGSIWSRSFGFWEIDNLDYETQDVIF